MRNNHHRARRYFVSRTIGFILCAATLGCGYPQVSPRTYDYATALYSICNQKDEARLDEFAKQFEADLLANELSQQEADWLGEIVAQARGGDWQQASAAARRILEDQVSTP